MPEEYPTPQGHPNVPEKKSKFWIITITIIGLVIILFLWWWFNDGGKVGFNTNNSQEISNTNQGAIEFTNVPPIELEVIDIPQGQ